jgi:N-acetylmuramoyl-L-alanine amidase
MTAWLSAVAAALLLPQGTGPIVVRSGDLSTPLPVLITQRGPMIRLEDGLQALGAALVRTGSDRYRMVVVGAEIDLTVGLAVAHTARSQEPLPTAPAVFEGKLLVPMALLTDVLPRVASGFTWVAGVRELRRAVPPPARVERAGTAVPQPAPGAGPPARRAPAPRIVVVDAGHGGPDRGMSGPLGSRRKVFEKDITLAVSRQVRDALQKRGVQVVMTRTRDTLIALGDRGRIANRANASAFVSIHVNAANPRWRDPRGARGFETFFLSEAKTDDERRVEEMENEAVKYEGEETFEVGDPLRFILNDMKQNEFLRESSDFAAVVQQSLADLPHPGPNRGVKQAGFRVLVSAYMPAVLVEIGFGSNADESAYLTSARGQRDIAAAIAEAVVTYLDRLDRKTQAGGR